MRLTEQITTLSDLLRRVVTHRFFRRTISLSSGVIIGQIAVVASTPLLTRLCSSGDFGQFAILYTIVVLFGIIGLLQLEVDLPLCAEDELPIALLTQALVGLVVLAIFLGGLALAPNFLDVLRPIPLWTWLLLPISCLLQIVTLSAAYLHVRSAAFSLYGRQHRNRLLGQAGGQLFMAWLGFGALGLFAGLIIGQAVALATGFRALLVVLARVRWSHRSAVRAYLHAKRQYPLHLLPANLLASATQLLPPVLVATLFSTIEAGILLLIQRLFAVPIRLISHNVSQVLLGELRDASGDTLVRLAGRALAVLACLGLGIMTIVLLPGDVGWRIILGPGWEGFWEILLYLAPLQIASFVSEAMRTLFLLGHQRLLLLQSIVCFSVLGAFFVPLLWPLSFSVTIGLYSFGTTVVYSVFIALLFVRLGKANSVSRGTINCNSASTPIGAERGEWR